jgi:hypothetical protein
MSLKLNELTVTNAINGSITGNAATATSATDSTKLPLTGGTLSGQLSINHSTATSVLRLYSGGSTVWSLGVGDNSGSYFNLSADFGSFTINKTNGFIGVGTTSQVTRLQLGSGTPTGTTDGIQFGSDTSARLYRSASGIITSPGTIAATFSGNLTGNVTGNVSGSSGSCTGNATTATTATSLNSSNSIARTGTSGNYNTDFQNTPAGTVRHQGDDSSATNNPGGTWWFIDNYRHSNGSNFWGTQVAWGWEDQANKLATRNITGGTFGSWVYYLNSVNYTDYTVTKTGTGASGSWGISVTGSSASCTGNAATATNLSTNRTNWSTNGTITAVVGQLSWKHYGNNHTIFDASNSTSPAGGAVNNTNPDVAWTGTYPTLMGWNGVNTYGVRVDSARYADSVTGTVAIANGGTGATTAANARTNLGATTVGGNFFTLTNPSAITFPRINADNTVSALDAATFRTAIGVGTGSGTVTSVSGTGTVSGLTLSGTVTTTGNLTLGGTLSVAASNFASQTANTFLAAPNGASGTPTFRAIVAADVPTLNQATTNNAGSVTYLPNRTDGTAYPVLWGAAYTNGSGTIAYSCAAVTILSSTGTLSATSFSGAGTGLTGTASSLTVGTANAVSTGAVKSGGLDTDSVITVKIANSNVTYAKIQNVSNTSRVLGRISAGAGVVEELTGANIATIIGTNTITNATTASALTTANSYTITGLTSNATVNIFPPLASGYSSFLKLGYDAISTADYTIRRNATSGFLEFDGNQTGYIGFMFNSGVVYSGTAATSAGAYYFNSTSHGVRRVSGTNDVYLFTTTGNLYLGTTGNTSQQIIINNSGNLGIGTSPSSYKLDVNGSCHATSFPTSSDERFKKKIKPLQNCVEKVKKMQGVSYEWNEFINNRRDGYSLNTPVFGVIAQDLEKVIPEVVSKWHLSDDCKDARAVDYIRIIPVLIEAIKEQQVELDDLKKRLLALENK